MATEVSDTREVRGYRDGDNHLLVTLQRPAEWDVEDGYDVKLTLHPDEDEPDISQVITYEELGVLIEALQEYQWEFAREI